MRIRDLMTKDVLTIGPEAPIKDVARILTEHRISGLPVCSIERHVLGVVSEADILYREYDPKEGQLRGPLGWLVDGVPDYAGYSKAKALTAGDAMTSPAVTIPPYETVAGAARLMTERRVNRLPVVQHGVLVGIVTRADLVRAFTRTDAELEREIREDLLRRTLWIDEGSVQVAVASGTATLTGGLQKRSDVELLERLVEGVPGVTAVRSSVAWRFDDKTREGRRQLDAAPFR